jgi:hypothetical protein
MVLDLARWRREGYTRCIERWMEIQRSPPSRIYELGSLPPFLLVFTGHVAPIEHRWNQHGLGGDNIHGSCRDLHPGPMSLLHWSGSGKRWARLGANDGLVSVASLMIGVSAATNAGKTMLVSGLAGLVAGACSMAIGEFVSVYVQYYIEVSQIRRDGPKTKDKDKENLPSPTRAALASAVAFAVGALVPLLAGGFLRQRSPGSGRCARRPQWGWQGSAPRAGTWAAPAWRGRRSGCLRAAGMPWPSRTACSGCSSRCSTYKSRRWVDVNRSVIGLVWQRSRGFTEIIQRLNCI